MAPLKSSRKRCWCISGIIAAVVIVVIIVVPTAVVLTRNKQPKSSILLPLYIYPSTNDTWSPLYNAIETHPDLNFTVIVNPSSGPGPTQYPINIYTTQIEQLNFYPNVRTVGYVRTGYATRNISDVLAEVSTYAGWSVKSSQLAMHGIFFDEAPHEYSASAVEFMRTINQFVKGATGLQGDRTIIHNPGTIPDARFNDTNTDITVVFEQSYEEYQVAQANVAALPKHRSEYSIMVHSVPTMGTDDLTKFVDKLGQQAEYLFVTSNDEEYYESFGSDWATFTDVVPSG